MAFVMNSPAFADGDPIPAKYTHDGDNISPPLEWRDPPPGTRSFVLVIDDPDAPSGLFRHWGVYNIPADCTSLPEAAETGRFGVAVNGFGNTRYDGPSPPEGHGRHTYHFRLAALRTAVLQLPASASVADLWAAAEPHVIGQAELVGSYERPGAAAATRRQPGSAAAGDERHEQRGPARAGIEEHVHTRPSKGDPVIHGGDAGGPNDGRNITTADLDHDAGKARPNVLEQSAFAASKPGEGGKPD